MSLKRTAITSASSAHERLRVSGDEHGVRAVWPAGDDSRLRRKTSSERSLRLSARSRLCLDSRMPQPGSAIEQIPSQSTIYLQLDLRLSIVPSKTERNLSHVYAIRQLRR